MARETNTTNFDPVIEAVQGWTRTCLISDDSMFSSEPLWTGEVIQELRAAFVDNPDTGDASFAEKLKKQLATTSASAGRLMAEMLWAVLAFPSNIKADTKRSQVSSVWSWSNEELPASHAMLRDEVLEGVGSAGQGYNNHRWKEIVFLIDLSGDLKARPKNERESLFTNYAEFVKWIQGIPTSQKRQFKHMLRYFTFPDRVERMSSNAHRRSVLAHFENLAESETKKWTDAELDDALLRLRKRLEAEYPNQKLDFYEDPLRPRWNPDGVPGVAADSATGAPDSGATSNDTMGTSSAIKSERYDKQKALQGLFIPETQFDEMLAALREKRNLVLQGAPGVGKTFVAKRLAWAYIGAKDPQRVETIQFHQSYSYEDFIQGYRPTAKGEFALRYGVFHQFCRRAQRDEGRPYVFIIDEINRGNLSKIFGELMMLIEPDKRGKDHAIPLAYSEDADEKFYIPKNLYVIGMMNTADRSLAMVDYALRRRFRFIELRPGFSNTAFADCLLDAGAAPTLIKKIVERMGALNKAISADTKNLGPGYEIGHSFFCPCNNGPLDDAWYRRIIESEIVPLIKEYWFDDDPKMAQERTALLI
jgi:hypothetical protein